MPKTITVLSETRSYSGKVFNVVDQKIQLPDGAIVSHSTVEHKGAVVILPVTSDGKILFVRQYRHSIGQEILEIPAGSLELNEDPLSAALRELSEETGFSAKKMVPLGMMYPVPGFCSEVHHAFVALELFAHKLPHDENEVIEVEPMTLLEVDAGIKDGNICDNKSIAILYKAKLLGLI